MSPRNVRKTPFGRLLLGLLIIYFLIRLLITFLRWLRPRPKPPVVEIEIPEAPPPVALEAPPGEAMEEIEVSFEVPAVVVAPVIPDIYTPLPPELLLESDETLTTADGKVIRYQFNWQNPQLLSKIYPFRLEKLRDFLLFFTEIDLVRQVKEKGVSDPSIQARLEQSKAAMQAQRVAIQQKMSQALAAKQAADPWFARITGANQKSLRFKQTYYVDGQIQRAQERLDQWLDQQQSLLKRVNWWPDDPVRQATWRGRAAELDPQIAQARKELEELKAFRDLFEQEAALPGEEVTIQDVLRWEMRQKKEQWKIDANADTLVVQNQLLKEIIQWVNREPDRFPEWLVYMVIHFSGMRYMSAHGSWASPRYLLEELKREDVEDEVKNLPQERLLQECLVVAGRLRQRLTSATLEQKKNLERVISRLSIPDRSAFLQVRIEEVLQDIQRLPENPNDKACLDALVRYKQEWDERARADPNDRIEPMPDWVWAEICKYTPLRLGTTDPNWEAYSPERWKWQFNRWREVLVSWQKRDITSWRQKHRNTLDLVVTRAVCNEIAEHIQHLRGLAPAAGLTAKPVWFQRQQGKVPGAYLKQAPAEVDLKPGASILWLEWVDQRPNEWQVARPLSGFVLAPTDQAAAGANKPKGEVSKKELERQKTQDDTWDYRAPANDYIRQRPLPTRDELRKQGKTDKEITQIMAQRKVTGDVETQYLRWRHEAVVVGVYDLIDGRYALTFETGQIGLILRPLRSLAGNSKIFIGYVPDNTLSPEMDQKLVNMLRWDRILPGVALPPRPRPKKIVDPALAPEVQEKPVVQQVEPTRPILVIREDIRTYKFTTRDKDGRPKMDPAIPVVKLARGTRAQVSKNRKESPSDTGDGVIRAQNGQFLRIVKCEDNSLAADLYVRLEDTADYGSGKWVEVHPLVDKGWTVCRVFKGQDAKGKPILEPVEDKDRRVLIPKGVRFRVSTTHKESSLDTGDGKIQPSSAPFHYLVLECPEVESAEGLYVEAAETRESPVI